jgi:hypothetical protein
MRSLARGHAAAALVLIAIISGDPGSAAQSRSDSRGLDATTPITYFIADGNQDFGYRASDHQLALWAFQDWQRNAGAQVRLEPAPESNAVIQLHWASPLGTQYGEMRPLTVGGRRGAAVFIRPDVEALGEDIARRARGDDLFREAIVYLTCVHELGHAFGLSHTAEFSDIMYSFGFGGDIVRYFERYRQRLRSRSDIATVSGLSPADADRVRALYATSK